MALFLLLLLLTTLRFVYDIEVPEYWSGLIFLSVAAVISVVLKIKRSYASYEKHKLLNVLVRIAIATSLFCLLASLASIASYEVSEETSRKLFLIGYAFNISGIITWIALSLRLKQKIRNAWLYWPLGAWIIYSAIIGWAIYVINTTM